MAKGLSLHIGLNSVDAIYYEGWSGPLMSCEADARDLEQLAASQGFKTSQLLTRRATRDAVLGSIRDAARALRAGDIFLLTYSGHGGTMEDQDGDENEDGAHPGKPDSTWCLYDGQLIDDEIYAVLGDFVTGVRIFALSDSCHSGTMLRERLFSSNEHRRFRAMPATIARSVYLAHRNFYDRIQKDPDLKNAETRVVASALLISGCQDEQLSGDGEKNGVFTARLKTVWNQNRFSGGYRDFYASILSDMPKDQTPNWFTVGRIDDVFYKQKPFLIVGDVRKDGEQVDDGDEDSSTTAKFVAAWSASKTAVVYRAENGSEEMRSAGTRSWRNCNPGNIVKGSFADSCGAIGSDTRFAIFPNENIGLSAISSLFKSVSYRDLTLTKAINRYAPPEDNNETSVYISVVAKALGVAATTIIHDLGKKQLKLLAQAIQKHEGWRPGETERLRGPAAPHADRQASEAESKISGFRASNEDATFIPELIEIGLDPVRCRNVRSKAFKAMTRIYGKPTAKNACACTLSKFLQEAGINVELDYSAGSLARALERGRGWERVNVGDQQPGDVAVTKDNTAPAGADHIYFVVKRLGADKMLIADNQTDTCPHERYASGRGQTAVAYFLRAPGYVTARSREADADNAVYEDQDTNDLQIRFNIDGILLD